MVPALGARGGGGAARSAMLRSRTARAVVARALEPVPKVPLAMLALAALEMREATAERKMLGERGDEGARTGGMLARRSRAAAAADSAAASWRRLIEAEAEAARPRPCMGVTLRGCWESCGVGWVWE